MVEEVFGAAGWRSTLPSDPAQMRLICVRPAGLAKTVPPSAGAASRPCSVLLQDQKS
jgi:hypothetical protein